MRLCRLLPVILFVLMVALSSGEGYTQIFKSTGIGSGWEQKKEVDKEKKKSDGPIRVKTVEELTGSNAWTDETRYFEDIRLDSLWYVGVGNPIPERMAAKMDKVYRMSMKLDNGKYIRVQCIGRGISHPSDRFNSLLLPAEIYDYDSELVAPWSDSENLITDICQYPALDNKTKALEMAYDAEGNVVRSASFEFPEADRALVVYYDCKGNIVNLTDPRKYKRGTIVIVDFNQGEMDYTVADLGGWPIVKVK